MSGQTFGTMERRAAEQRAAGRAATSGEEAAESFDAVPNGPGAAAILAAGIGSFFLGLFATVGDAFPPVNQFFNFWHPTGPLSGVTSTAIIIWLVAWYGLHQAWKSANVALAKVNVVAFVLLAGGVLLTFPPFMDLLQGK